MLQLLLHAVISASAIKQDDAVLLPWVLSSQLCCKPVRHFGYFCCYHEVCPLSLLPTSAYSYFYSNCFCHESSLPAASPYIISAILLQLLPPWVFSACCKPAEHLGFTTSSAPAMRSIFSACWKPANHLGVLGNLICCYCYHKVSHELHITAGCIVPSANATSANEWIGSAGAC